MTLSGIQFVTGKAITLPDIDSTETRHGVHQRTWRYSPTQQSRRFWKAGQLPGQGKKVVLPFVGVPDRPWERWDNFKGAAPWPAYFTHSPEPSWRDCWLLEHEGEKCADIGAAAGFPGISQPGFDRQPDQIQRRYRDLKPLVAGIVYLADNDVEGRRKAKEAQEAWRVRERESLDGRQPGPKRRPA